ncbi:hypothetical protein ACSL103130_03595 [Actinomyces slackii]|uniref:Uncharacterized protein n=1 Tax=Actinomyces slackii TaxID=52774 RepID=A0A448KGB0_9ACTO|nr:hypothetical protein [Actinomyces slackii]VEG75930.1 Uncharacterised protein [Actinomyces slackii]
MDETVRVHPRVSVRHPGITPQDVKTAFLGALRSRARDTDPVQWVGVGLDGRGRLLEFIAVELDSHEWLVFHAMVATTKVLREIGMRR